MPSVDLGRRDLAVTTNRSQGHHTVSFRLLLGCLLVSAPLLVPAQVVINEIMYHAPDELDDLQFVELYNSGSQPVDLSDWAFTKGIKLKFPAGTSLDAQGFLVVCQNAERFKEFYKAPVAGVFESKLKHKGERIELSDASGKRVDSVKFGDQAPWPTGADGHSGSLERISPSVPGDDPANWIASPLSETREKPAGTPGKSNAGFSTTPPPVITSVKFSPELPAPNQPVTVGAELPTGETVSGVNLRFRLAGPGYEKAEITVPMNSTTPGHYTATIPGQAAGQLTRFRVEAIGSKGARRFFPAETEPKPALSAYVPTTVEPAKIPFGWIIHTSEKEMKAAEARANTPTFEGFRPPPMTPEDEARNQAQRLFDEKLDFSRLWWELAVGSGTGDPKLLSTLRPLLVAKLAERKKLMETSLASEGITERIEQLPPVVDTFSTALVSEVEPKLSDRQKASLEKWLERQGTPRPRLERMVSARLDLEGAWYAVSLNTEPDAERLPRLLSAFADLNRQRSETLSAVASAVDTDNAGRDQLRRRVEELRGRIETTLKPLLSDAQSLQLEAWSRMPREMVVGLRETPPGFGGPPPGFGRGPGGPGGPGGPPPGFAFGPGGFRGGPRGPGGPGGPGFFRGGPFGQQPTEPTSFTSAFVYFDPATRKHELFDFVQITGRKGGQKVHFYKDHPLEEMTTIALIFEGETAALVEPLAYEVYRRAGMPVEQSHYVRLWQDGKPTGYTLLIEQPNRAFLRRNQINDDGTMYKLLWFGGDLIGQHEKHTHKHLGHADLTAVVEGLEKNSGDAQWEFIQKNFDVDQVATYFAVNMVLSHWDGFFNNYFTYHDSEGTGKWMMFPWDQDSTWGLRGGEGRNVFYTMALTFGMNGDQPSADGGSWRPPGFFSGPLLANPQFRQVFLSRTKQILENVYTEAVFGPVITAWEERLLPEVKLRAEIQKQDPERAVASFKSDLARCRQHLRQRREFLLAQKELKRVGSEVSPTAPAAKKN